MISVNILFTGGYDSTFRLLQLASESIVIQPIYIISKNRSGSEYERKAIDGIINIIRKNGNGEDKYDFKAQIRDVKYYTVDWIFENCKDDEISVAFKYLRDKYSVGLQYEWFALLTKYLSIKMECGVIHQYHGKVEDAIAEEGELELIPYDILPNRYHVLPSIRSDKAFLVFGNLILPIIKLTKEDEIFESTKNGWENIMNLTWFCHSPIKGEPCGLCSPCEDAMNTGMEWRMPPSAKRRYKFRRVYHFFDRVKSFLRKIKRHVSILVKRLAGKNE